MHLGPPIRRPSEPKPGELCYRLYFLGGRTGHTIERSHQCFAADDEQAIKMAEAWREGRKIELWERARIVKIWS